MTRTSRDRADPCYTPTCVSLFGSARVPMHVNSRKKVAYNCSSVDHLGLFGHMNSDAATSDFFAVNDDVVGTRCKFE